MSFMVTCSGADMLPLVLGSLNEAGTSMMTEKMLMLLVKMTTVIIMEYT